MSSYVINFTDPLRDTVTITSGGFNGPGGATTSTSLRLYGRGALEWGEAVDENLVRLAENFAGATPPIVPVAGQTWLRQQLYVRHVSGSTTVAWYRWNFNSDTWSPITVAETANINTYPAGSAAGQYVFDTTGNKLYRWDSAYAQAPLAWLVRSHLAQGSAPGVNQRPQQTMLVYDEYAADWIVPPSTYVGNTSELPPAQGGTGDREGSYNGEFFYDNDTGKLYIWNATDNEWKIIFGPATETVGPTQSMAISGNLDMNSYEITELTTPALPTSQHAVNVSYLQSYVSTFVGTNFVPLTGGASMGGGTYTINGTTFSVGGVVGLSNHIDMNNQQIRELATPTASTDATTKNYVDSSISTAISGLGGITASSVALVNPAGAPKDGDIRAFPPNVVEIYSTGAWRRVFPAQWV